MQYYIDVRTMTKWRKKGDTFHPFGAWCIARDPKDVLQDALMTGPFYKEEITK